MTDLVEGARGPAMAGRLRGTAFQITMAMTIPRCRGPTSLIEHPIGVDLLGQTSIPAFTTSDTGEYVNAQHAGHVILLEYLRAEYDVKTQDMTLAALDNWDSLYIKSGQQRSQFMLLYRMAYEEAVAHGGMEMNPVAKTYYLFKKLGISKNERRDILLKTNGDLSQFENICSLISNLAADEENRAHGSTRTNMAGQFHTQDGEYGEDSSYQYYDADDWSHETWCTTEEPWYQDEYGTWHTWHAEDPSWSQDDWYDDSWAYAQEPAAPAATEETLDGKVLD